MRRGFCVLPGVVAFLAGWLKAKTEFFAIGCAEDRLFLIADSKNKADSDCRCCGVRNATFPDLFGGFGKSVAKLFKIGVFHQKIKKFSMARTPFCWTLLGLGAEEDWKIKNFDNKYRCCGGHSA